MAAAEGASRRSDDQRLYSDGRFPTADGRAKLICVDWEPFPEQPNAEFPLVLNTGRTVEHWHTRTKTGAVPILEALSPSAWLEMNPRDASDWVSAVTTGGYRLAPRTVRDVELRLTEITAPGQIFMPFHYFETNVTR